MRAACAADATSACSCCFTFDLPNGFDFTGIFLLSFSLPAVFFAGGLPCWIGLLVDCRVRFFGTVQAVRSVPFVPSSNSRRCCCWLSNSLLVGLCTLFLPFWLSVSSLVSPVTSSGSSISTASSSLGSLSDSAHSAIRSLASIAN